MNKPVFSRIHWEGVLFGTAFAVISYILYLLYLPLGILGAILTGWCFYFFRNPDRVTPTKPGLIISPADGLIQHITQVRPPVEMNLGNKKLTRISIFMNVFNVHINRVPMDGTIKVVHYHPGKFLNAALDKASDENERQMYVVENKDAAVGFVQIAGLIARRIRCNITVGQVLKAGTRFGLIRFGSRVDVFLPAGVTPLVVEGQLALAGETVLADIHSKEQNWHGEVR